MKKVLMLFSFLLILISCDSGLSFLDIRNISKIIITDSENIFEINDNQEIRYLVSQFKKVVRFTGNPSCPFEYVKIIVYNKNETKFIINYASDLCPIFKYKKIPYKLDEVSNLNIRRLLREHGIKDHIW